MMAHFMAIFSATENSDSWSPWLHKTNIIMYKRSVHSGDMKSKQITKITTLN